VTDDRTLFPVSPADELAAITKAVEALLPLQDDKAALQRALRYLNERFRPSGGAPRNGTGVPRNVLHQTGGLSGWLNGVYHADMDPDRKGIQDGMSLMKAPADA
jgi:hypothetical protein